VVTDTEKDNKMKFQHYSKRRPKRFEAETSPSGTFTAVQVAQLYGFPPGSGAGQGIGLIELGGGWSSGDLVSAGITNTVIDVLIDGATNDYTGDPNSADGEVALDIQIAAAIAPAALIKVFFAPNTNQGFLDAINAAVQDPQVNIISISWGGPENTWGTSALQQFDAAFAKAGKLIFVASGDSGSSDGEKGKNVDFPASSPHVIACGATSLVANAAMTSIASEVVWNSDGGSSGGGISSFFALPAFQAKAKVPGGKFRGVPDVAANGDPETGFQVIVAGVQEIYGGTSCDAPLYAGLFARIAPGISSAFLNGILYEYGLPAGSELDFNEITSGSNGSYSACPGWNPCCGLGSPRGTAIEGSVLGSTPAPVPPTPIP